MKPKNGIACICTLVLLAACASKTHTPAPRLDPEPITPGARFIVQVQTGQSVDDVKSAAGGYFGGDPAVEQMFAGINDSELERYYLVATASPQEPQDAWDQARALRSAGNFESAEPDQFETLQRETDRVREATAACLFGGHNAPADKAWSLRKINAAEAWALLPPANGKRFGEGVRICHPDTGWTVHDDLDGLDRDSAWNVIDQTPDAKDPKNDGTFLNPGHGTATGSVISSDGGIHPVSGTTPPGKITGVAPAATLVPIRTVNSVVQLFDSDVAQAVAYSVGAQCDVISMSLGGRAFSGLKSAVRYAADNGLIVVAAAGNCVGMVVAPAAYDDAIAVAATNIEDKPWKGSSRGRAVAIAAPGENVWKAHNPEDPDTSQATQPGNGTSFATAEVAGAAALWLAYHGRSAIEAAATPRRVQDLFIEIARDTSRVPEGWNERRYGSGVLDAKALLEARLDGARAPVPAPVRSAYGETVDTIAKMTDRDASDIEDALTVMLNDPDDLESSVDTWGPELIDVALRDPIAFQRALDEALLATSGARDAGTRDSARNSARGEIDALLSQSLRDAIR